MTEKITLKASVRELQGSGNARRIRKAGNIPAVLYNDKTEVQSIVVDAVEVRPFLHHHGVMTMDLDGTNKAVIIKDVQYNNLSGQTLHIDFMEVDMTHEVTAVVPVEPVGTPAGASKGGQLEQGLHEIEIKCLPANLVEEVKVDVSGMDLDAVMLVSDLVLPEGIVAITNGETSVFQVHGAKSEAAATEGESAE